MGVTKVGHGIEGGIECGYCQNHEGDCFGVVVRANLWGFDGTLGV